MAAVPWPRCRALRTPGAMASAGFCSAASGIAGGAARRRPDADQRRQRPARGGGQLDRCDLRARRRPADDRGRRGGEGGDGHLSRYRQDPPVVQSPVRRYCTRPTATGRPGLVPGLDRHVGDGQRATRPQRPAGDAVDAGRRHPQEVGAQVDRDVGARPGVHDGVPAGRVHAGGERAAVHERAVVGGERGRAWSRAQDRGAVVVVGVQVEADGGVERGGGHRRACSQREPEA